MDDTSPAEVRPTRFQAVVLAGGGGRRLGGVDKAALDIAGRTLVERALAAVAQAETVVVVGPPRALPAGVLGTQEQPAGGGPVAALAAGLDVLSGGAVTTVSSSGPTSGEAGGHGARLVVVLACDMPFVDAAAIDRLVLAVTPGVDGAAFVDADGRRQHLAAAYRFASVRAALNRLGEVRDAAMRDLASRLTVVEVEADPETTLDCDTWDDVDRSRDALEER